MRKKYAIFVTIVAVNLVALATVFGSVQLGDCRDCDVALLGPILLGDTYDKMPDQKELMKLLMKLPYEHLSKELKIDARTHSKLVESMNKCKIFIAENVKRSGKDGKRIKVDDDRLREGITTVVLEGTCTFDFVGSLGEKVIVSVKKVTPGKIGTERSPTTAAVSSGNLLVELSVTWLNKEKPATHRDYVFVTRELRWTVNRMLKEGEEAPTEINNGRP